MMRDPLDGTHTTNDGLERDSTLHELPEAVTLLFRTASRFDPTDPSPALIRAMSASISEPKSPTRSPSMIAKTATAKAAVTAAVLLGTTGVAAATGSLPAAAQDGVATAASHVGINLPSSADDRARANTDQIGPAADTHGAEVSRVATETEATGADKGAEISSIARGEHGSGRDAHAPATGADDNPAPVDTPNPGGVETGVEASDGANSTGAAKAAASASDGSGSSDEDHPPSSDD